MNWRKSSRSNPNGECAEVGSWRKSSASKANGNCAEIGQGEAMIGVRDTKQAHLGDARTVLEFSTEAWRDFARRVRDDAVGR